MSFKLGKKAYFYAGPQGDRSKAVFELNASIPEAKRLAKDDADRFEVGMTVWVTARFTAEKPIPKRLWEKWLAESYRIAE